MKYYDGYKYVVGETFSVQTQIFPEKNIQTKYIELDIYGLITIKDGFPWDGASGPTIDTDNTMTPSCVHDALYWLFRHGFLDIGWLDLADQLIHEMLLDRGMTEFRAGYWDLGLEIADGGAALPENKKKMIEVP